MESNLLEIIETLELFTEQANRLYNSKFVTWARTVDKIQIIMTADEKGAEVAVNWPEEDEINAFLLPFRFLIQDNERCSWNNISKLYEELEITPSYKESFLNSRKNLNEYLDSKIVEFALHGKHYTHREVLDTFVYGYYAHSNKEKRKLFDEWKKNLFGFKNLEFFFINTIVDISELTYRISETVNKPVINELKSSLQQEIV